MPAKESPFLYHLTLDSRSLYRLFSKYLLTDDQLEVNGFPRESLHNPGKIIISEDSSYGRKSNKRRCARCNKSYHTDSNPENCRTKPCFYHPKKVDVRSGSYPCCRQKFRSFGCTRGKHHVSSECNLHDVEFKKTVPGRKFYPCNVFALDCEMIYTTGGLELAKVAIVDINGKTVYESFVMPEMPILDYNTEYSGVTSDDCVHTKASYFSDVQNVILNEVLNEDSILIGHGLENDLRALRLIHKKVVDTSVLFPHERAKYKKSLKNLAKGILNKDIQTAADGHDCGEDARTAMELVLYKINLDFYLDISLTSFPAAPSKKRPNQANTPPPAHQPSKLDPRHSEDVKLVHVSHTVPSLVVQSENNCKLINTPPLAKAMVPDFLDPGIESLFLHSFMHEKPKDVRQAEARVDAELVSYRHGVRDSRTIVQDENNCNSINTSPISKQSSTVNSFGYNDQSLPDWMREYQQALYDSDSEIRAWGKTCEEESSQKRWEKVNQHEVFVQDENAHSFVNTPTTPQFSSLNSPRHEGYKLQNGMYGEFYDPVPQQRFHLSQRMHHETYRPSGDMICYNTAFPPARSPARIKNDCRYYQPSAINVPPMWGMVPH